MCTFDRNALLGIGGYGSVFLGKWTNEKGVQIEVAVKRVQLHLVKVESVAMKLDILKRVQKNDQHEEKNLKKLNHPNIVKMFDVQDDMDFRYRRLIKI